MRIFIVFLFLTSSIFAQNPAEWDFLDPDENLKSLVLVEMSINTSNGLAVGHGSGVIIAFKDEFDETKKFRKALILTAHHVVDSATKVSCTSFDGLSYQPFITLAFDKANDLALIEGFVSAECRSLAVSDSPPKFGDDVRLAGFPLKKKNRKYWRAKVARVTHSHNKVFVDEDVRPGASGGFIIDKDNKIVGIISGGAEWFQAKDEPPYTWPTRAGSTGAIKNLVAAFVCVGVYPEEKFTVPEKVPLLLNGILLEGAIIDNSSTK